MTARLLRPLRTPTALDSIAQGRGLAAHPGVKRVIERNPRSISRARRESQRDGILNRHRIQDRAVASRLRTSLGYVNLGFHSLRELHPRLLAAVALRLQSIDAPVTPTGPSLRSDRSDPEPTRKQSVCIGQNSFRPWFEDNVGRFGSAPSQQIPQFTA